MTATLPRCCRVTAIGSGYAAAMTMSCPPLVRKLVIAEDPQLAAQISCALAIPGHYLPVIEGPRFLPPIRPWSLFAGIMRQEEYGRNQSTWWDFRITRSTR
jgi:hypothetical protein